MTKQPDSEVSPAEAASPSGNKPPARLKARFLKLARRAHLYAGLFLLPWVFLYGVTGAMFNHQGLFPAIETREVPAAALADGALKDFPAPDELAGRVVAALRAAAPDAAVSLAADHRAAYNNELALETRVEGGKRVIRIDPVARSATIVTPPENDELAPQTRLLDDVRNLRLDPDPHALAQSAAPEIMAAAGQGSPAPTRPLGWCKLNFLAEVNGEPARVTYVLRDRHVDVTRFTGKDGMAARQFFLRLHTFHGRTPGWSARNAWSLFIDAMAIAMVLWGVTGLVMWWQLKSVRLVGGIVILASAIVAAVMCWQMALFHATTKM